MRDASASAMDDIIERMRQLEAQLTAAREATKAALAAEADTRHQVRETCRNRIPLPVQGGKGRGRVRIQIHCISGPCTPPQVQRGWLGFVVNCKGLLKFKGF